ncbi:MAG: hypothetical protein B0D96_10010 [Candidatus Sedimenticola endophacoides]|uniref:BolA family transcriptional regulator n=2 Tax=Candidatus Sedimenticola endophacoides TaxID=2548426 RepID=A0A657PNU0_9GAMM|nr:MAG: hypothetical protein B0D94_00730 [Candidatus Sedimenticola endophacoides]OQX34169.1 MAG: hypothetical protein B0D96_10010 [Candidatus Sedimenticola endophacoides]OQX37694.1 MAG: hypothetical protein B0D84_00340 [Candidatus Sedimenticola endophacoides]OQX42348.1 MAG: hypothetical protein B0D82_01210 [Candidatus Sedimenticola endophacoides]OQX42733.1 MAG: hypothetical protein B0D89_00640 [Candidatus Sedimenticola endophacoides]
MMQQEIEERLHQALAPTHLEVINESHMHAVARDAETHFKVVVVSRQFEGHLLLARHREVNALLKPLFVHGLHALALHTMTPDEWFERGGESPASPECLGVARPERAGLNAEPREPGRSQRRRRAIRRALNAQVKTLI